MRQSSKDLPEWFNSALENTRRNYARINLLNQECPCCGCTIHVATGWIGKPKQEKEMSLRDYRPDVYPFCACAQGSESERLLSLAERSAKWWESMAAWYHQHIAVPESEQHRVNMLQGYPTWKLTKYIIDPNQEDADVGGRGVS